MKQKSSKRIPERSEKVRDETLRGENRRLRKEVSRLRKEVDKLRGTFGESEEQDYDIDTVLEEANKPRCPKCSAFIKPFELREKIYYVCDCGSRGILK